MVCTASTAATAASVTKQELAARALRERIATGVYQPASRLPSWVELAAEFKVSSVTIERTMAMLAQEGFTEGRGRHGTFVVVHPPHLSLFALLFPANPGPRSAHPWSHFYSALCRAAERRERLDAFCRVPRHYDIFPGQETPAFRQLAEEVRNHRLAGLILAVPHLAVARELFDPAVPVVLLGGAAAGVSVPSVYSDLSSFYRRALQRLRAQGRTRVGLISARWAEQAWEQQFPALCREFGLASDPCLVQFPNLGHASSAAQSVRLLLSLPDAQRPDALIIDDDHLVASATAGVQAAGFADSARLGVMAFANYPNVQPAAVPVDVLGFDAAKILDHCIRVIEQKRQGHAVPAATPVPAEFAAELTNHGARVSP